jgi:indole-3-glycerol phosphate synthase
MKIAKGFVETGTVLDEILAYKVQETSTCKAVTPIEKLIEEIQSAPAPRDFIGALQKDNVALIAEVKKASPSKGILIENFDPVAIATTYAENGAAAISVLTDEKFFQGNIRYLKRIHKAVDVPLLMKEFILDSYQIYEGRAAGADAALLIAAALADAQLAEFQQIIHDLGMTALVEVHNESEMERALKIGATLIGINNRDLKTFKEDLSISERLAKLVPSGVTLVAESAIRSPEDVKRMGNAGVHAILVGEGLVKAADMAAQVQLFSSQPRNNL